MTGSKFMLICKGLFYLASAAALLIGAYGQYRLNRLSGWVGDTNAALHSVAAKQVKIQRDIGSQP